MAPASQRVIVIFNVILLAALLIEHQTLLPNTKASIEQQINRLMEESAHTTAYTVETLQNDVHTLMEDAAKMMGSTSSKNANANANTNTNADAQATKTKNPIPQSNTLNCPETLLSSTPIPQDIFESTNNQQDQQLLQWFGKLCNGTYLELWAGDGIQSSTSFIFSKYRQWKGLLLEPNPNPYYLLQTNRPQELAIVQSAICEKDNSTAKIDEGGQVPCQTLSKIIQRYLQTSSFYFDFATIDTKGTVEYKAIQSLDFQKIQFGMIALYADPENELRNLAMKSLLEDNGYTFLMRKKNYYWFYNQNWHNIYAKVV